MKTYRPTQLFLYCSGGDHSVKCVRPVLEMEPSKEEQRGVVHFLLAQGIGTREIDRRISAVYGEHSMSLTSVHEWQRYSAKDAHHCKTICARDRPIEPLHLM